MFFNLIFRYKICPANLFDRKLWWSNSSIFNLINNRFHVKSKFFLCLEKASSGLWCLPVSCRKQRTANGTCANARARILIPSNRKFLFYTCVRARENVHANVCVCLEHRMAKQRLRNGIEYVGQASTVYEFLFGMCVSGWSAHPHSNNHLHQCVCVSFWSRLRRCFA